MKIDGGCHCGYITYEAEADPQKPLYLSLYRLPGAFRFRVPDRYSGRKR